MNLEAGILKTLAYFDLIDYPLTTGEVWKWAWQVERGSLSEVTSALARLQQQGRIQQTGPFWYLVGRVAIVGTRQERHLASIKKLQIAQRFARVSAWVPTVVGIAAGNTVGYRNARPSSDIDFLVITRPRTIWLTRACLIMLAIIVGRRPSIQHSADTLCLSFFISQDQLDLAGLQKKDGDPYLAFWINQLTPLCGRGQIWSDFWQANSWAKHSLPHAATYEPRANWLYKNNSTQTSWLFKIFSKLEPLAKNLQIKRLPVELKNKARQGGSDVVITSQVLKFHSNDKREQYRDRWLAHCQTLKIN